MNEQEYLEKKKTSSVVKTLVELLNIYSKSDEYIDGILSVLDNEDECKELIDYIQNGEDVNYSNILLMAWDINDNRR